MGTMWNDVIDFRDFYATALGQVARRAIRGRIRGLWSDAHGLRVLGLGFATPYLLPFLDEAERVVAAMPASLGVLPWPSDGRNLVALADETELPFPDRTFDRLLVVHQLETSEHVRALMRELWRVLADGGRLLVVVPNRIGIWARLERTPFGVGRPYTAAQLKDLLRETMFTPEQVTPALYLPPSRSLLGSAPAWERMGPRWFPRLSGVLLAEATKQIYAAPYAHAAHRARRATIPLPQRLGRWHNSLPPLA